MSSTAVKWTSADLSFAAINARDNSVFESKREDFFIFSMKLSLIQSERIQKVPVWKLHTVFLFSPFSRLLAMTTLGGWAHLCFLSPPDQGNAYERVRGHMIARTETGQCTLGIAGQRLRNHADPNHNDCLAPVTYYRMTVQNYQTKAEASVIVCRVSDDDAAGLDPPHTPEEGEPFLTFHTDLFLTGERAWQHATTYLPDESEANQDTIVCVGQMTLKNMDV